MSLAGFKAKNHPQQTAKRGATDTVDDRGTDPVYFASVEERYGKFTLDAAAAPHNAKAARYFTLEDDGLSRSWAGARVWCNPPYSNLGAWVQKAWAEWSERDTFYARAAVDNDAALPVEFIAMLLPANRTEQGWWQDHVEPYRDRPGSPLRVEFLRGRMRFVRPDWTPGPKGDRPPFGCCLLTWRTA